MIRGTSDQGRERAPLLFGLAGLALAAVPLAAGSPADQLPLLVVRPAMAGPMDQAPPGAADPYVQVSEALARGDHQAAMAAAHGVDADGPRFALETEILYKAHSYAAALGRGAEAFALGERAPAFLSYAAQAAIWERDLAETGRFLDALDQALLSEPSLGVSWGDYVQELRAFEADLKAERQDVDRAVARGRWIAGGLGLMMLIGMALALPRRRLD